MRPKTPGIAFKNMAFSEGNQLFAGDFQAVLDETNAIMLQFRNGTGNTFAESFQLQMSTLHQSMGIFKAGLSSDGWAKYKEKVTDVSDSNQNDETTRNSKLTFTELKDLFIKRVQRNYVVKDELRSM